MNSSEYLNAYPIRLRLATIPFDGCEENPIEFDEFGYNDIGEAMRDYNSVNDFITDMAQSFKYGYRLELMQSNICHQFKAWDYDGSICEENNTLHPHNCLYKEIQRNSSEYDPVEYSEHPYPLNHIGLAAVMKW